MAQLLTVASYQEELQPLIDKGFNLSFAPAEAGHLAVLTGSDEKTGANFQVKVPWLSPGYVSEFLKGTVENLLFEMQQRTPLPDMLVWLANGEKKKPQYHRQLNTVLGPGYNPEDLEDARFRLANRLTLRVQGIEDALTKPAYENDVVELHHGSSAGWGYIFEVSPNHFRIRTADGNALSISEVNFGIIRYNRFQDTAAFCGLFPDA